MEKLAVMMSRVCAAWVVPRPRDGRGDVPGWVLVTVMSAGIVMVIWGVAEGALSQMLRDALNSVK